MLRALVVDESVVLAEAASSADLTMMTQGTMLTASITQTAKSAGAPDSPARPSPAAALRLLCACAESFPRGECWTSSARRGWSTVVDNGPYPPGTLEIAIERHGSSPADAATRTCSCGRWSTYRR